MEKIKCMLVSKVRHHCERTYLIILVIQTLVVIILNWYMKYSVWPVGTSSIWLLNPFDTTLVVFNRFFATQHDKIFQAYLINILWHFKTTTWALWMLIAMGLVIVFRSFQWKEPRNICIFSKIKYLMTSYWYF